MYEVFVEGFTNFQIIFWQMIGPIFILVGTFFMVWLLYKAFKFKF